MPTTLNLEKYLNFNLCTAYMDAKPINIFLTCDIVEYNPSTLYTTKIEIINKRKTTVQIVLSPSNFIFLERFNICDYKLLTDFLNSNPLSSKLENISKLAQAGDNNTASPFFAN